MCVDHRIMVKDDLQGVVTRNLETILIYKFKVCVPNYVFKP